MKIYCSYKMFKSLLIIVTVVGLSGCFEGNPHRESIFTKKEKTEDMGIWAEDKGEQSLFDKLPALGDIYSTKKKGTEPDA